MKKNSRKLAVAYTSSALFLAFLSAVYGFAVPALVSADDTLLLHAAAQPFSDAPEAALDYLEDCYNNLRQHYKAGITGTACGSVEEMKMEPIVGPKQ